MIDLTKFDGDVVLKGVDGKEYIIDAEEVLLWSEQEVSEEDSKDELAFCVKLADFIESRSVPSGIKLGKSKTLRIRHAMHCWIAIQSAVQEYQRFFAQEFGVMRSSEAQKNRHQGVQSPEPRTTVPST